MTNEPTDEALENLFVEETGFDIDDFPAAIFGFARAVLAKWGTPAGAGEPFGYFHQLLNHEGRGNGVWLGAAERKVVEQAHTPGETSEEIVTLYTAPQPTQTQPVAREPLPKFLALKFHARRDKKATVTLLFPGHEAADAWVRGIKVGQHVVE